MKILFICTGNICRSPAAATILWKLISQKSLPEEVIVDSAGTFGMYRPTPPEQGLVKAAKALGYEITGLSRKVSSEDLNSSDMVICMDESNFNDIKRMMHQEQIPKLHRFVEFMDDSKLKSIPDPYGVSESEYLQVFRLLEQGCRNLLNQINL